MLCLPVRPGLGERIQLAARYAAAQDASFTVVSVRPPGLTADEKVLMRAQLGTRRPAPGTEVPSHPSRLAWNQTVSSAPPRLGLPGGVVEPDAERAVLSDEGEANVGPPRR